MAESKTSKPIYGPVPVRAARDRRVTDHMLRTLIIVAAHDRLNKNNSGCYATQRRLANLIGGDHTRISKSLAGLTELGYLTCTPNAINARVNVYRVVYNDDDRAIMVGAIANMDIGGPANTGVASSSYDIGEKANHGRSHVGGTNGQAYESNERSDVNILSEATNTSSEAKIHSLERAAQGAAGLGNGRRYANLGADLAIIERELKNGAKLDPITENWLTNLLDTYDTNEAEACQAQRILDEFGGQT